MAPPVDGPPLSTHQRNNSVGSTGSSNQSIDTSPATSQSAFRQDPLAALERALLAHPATHHYWHRHHHHHRGGDHLAPPNLSHQRQHSRSRSGSRCHSRTPGRSPSPSPSPSPAARRCMETTAAWTPSLDRRQSWDGQEYRRAMMLQGTGLVCRCHPEETQEEHNQGRHHHRHPALPPTAVGMVTSRSVYEADRGFSEVNRPGQV
ncbi:hypothetical protein SEUCBS139899_002576 [Sporothrix eucalyptigena]|uniref:Uncharacterized protein n=1 Tax=Sporothrix eucalyptigena TaxID=1812306 RepID=A0ABP0BJN4_9PEZI